MALQFFRKHQKMVFIIMVALMVSFLVGGYGLSQFVTRSSRGDTVATTKLGKISIGELQEADFERAMVEEILGLEGDQDYGAIMANGGRAPLAYTLLLKEAKAASIMVASDDVDAYLAQRQLEGARFESLLTALRTRWPSVNAAAVRTSVANWLRIKKLFVQSLFYSQMGGLPVGMAASETELRRLYCDLNEKIDLTVATIKAADFLDRVPQPTDDEVSKQFAEYRQQEGGVYSKDNPFGFGYFQHDRASLLYLLVRQDAVERVVKPSDKDLRDYYRANRARLVRKVPVGDSETPSASGAPASQPGSQPTIYSTEPMTFPEAREQISELLTGPAVREALNGAVGQIRIMMDRYQQKEGGPDAYHWALSSMTGPADSLLQREIENLDIKSQPLNVAVAALAEKAQLTAIAFPWGQHGDVNLDPNVKVTLDASKMTLGQALDDICRQVKLPKLSWATCTAFEGALFSVARDGEGIDFFPIEVRKTAMMDDAEMMADGVLGQCYTSAEKPLADLVYTAQALDPSSSSGMKEGDDGPRMVVIGPRGGRLLWRLVATSPRHAPLTMDEAPGLADQVKNDVRMWAAFELAVKEADKLRERASKVGLAKAAEEMKLKTFQTDMFSRAVEISPQRQYQMLAQLAGRRISLEQMAMLPPFDYPPSQVPDLELRSRPVGELFIDAAFALVPENVEPPYPASSPVTAMVALPFERQALVVERTGYQPAVISDYIESKQILAAKIELNRIWAFRIVWFSITGVEKRLDCKLEGAPRQPT